MQNKRILARQNEQKNQVQPHLGFRFLGDPLPGGPGKGKTIMKKTVKQQHKLQNSYKKGKQTKAYPNHLFYHFKLSRRLLYRLLVCKTRAKMKQPPGSWPRLPGHSLCVLLCNPLVDSQ